MSNHFPVSSIYSIHVFSVHPPCLKPPHWFPFRPTYAYLILIFMDGDGDVYFINDIVFNKLNSCSNKNLTLKLMNF